ncbi:DUF4299 family protein [Helicobacter sp. 11S02629-2]|uniref:DUF4299 family protein n=1 Tax=Helicobacter sp. 11S02629-2 TaxID=1476195 RepID=UPI000BA4FE69|nr:DUF4299 family protein [Helicobacter sp. 11S02629-2]PAF44939.1 hypothetical protein BKH40_04435 [Helicobacter sp. 11S02629-2]
MAQTFSIKDTHKNPLTVDDLLLAMDDLLVYNMDAEDVNDILLAPLDEVDFLSLGVEGLSGRGFHLCYEDEAYKISFATPSTLADWKLGLDFMKLLAKRLDSKIENEEGNIYNSDNINYNYLEDISAGLKSLMEQTSNGDNCIILGINHPMSFNKEMMDSIFAADDPLKAFSLMLTENQNIDAYFVNQQFYKAQEDGKESSDMLALYTLTQDLPTILPLKPEVEFEYEDTIDKDKIVGWEVCLIAINGDEDDIDSFETLGYVDYDDFIARLPKSKYKLIDASYILVDRLDRADLDALLD